MDFSYSLSTRRAIRNYSSVDVRIPGSIYAFYNNSDPIPVEIFSFEDWYWFLICQYTSRKCHSKHEGKVCSREPTYLCFKLAGLLASVLPLAGFRCPLPQNHKPMLVQLARLRSECLYVLFDPLWENIVVDKHATTWPKSITTWMIMAWMIHYSAVLFIFVLRKRQNTLIFKLS